MKHPRWILTTLTLAGILGLAACATHSANQPAQEFILGQTLYQQQNYGAAFSHLMNAALTGNSNAEYAVGYMLYNGIGVKRDQTQALAWLNKAAKHGNIRAIAALQKLEALAEKQSYQLP